VSIPHAIGDLNDSGPARVRRTSEEPRELAAGLVASCIRQPLELEQVAGRDRATREQVPGVGGALVQQFVQLVEVVALVGEVGQSVQGSLVAVVRERSQGVPIAVHVGHAHMVRPFLPEPDRDIFGYRRYTAQNAVDLIKIRTLAEAGVPLARIRELPAAPDDEFQRALADI